MDYRFLISIMVLLLVSSASAANEVDLSVDEAIIYPQSVALVYESGTESSGTEFMAGINTNAYTNSIRVSGASEMSVSSSPYIIPYMEYENPVKQLLEQVLGKRVTLGDTEGVLEWLGDSWLGISTDTSHIVMPISSVSKIESEIALAEPNETKESSGSQINVTWMSQGGRSVKISYLANGLSWTPVYFLDAGDTTSRFEFWAKVGNSFEDLDSRIKLIGGDIKISGGSSYRYYDTNAQMAMSAGYAMAEDAYFDDAPTVSTAGEYEVYDLGKKTLSKGESRLISIFSGTVTPEKEYVWYTSSGDKVQRIYVVENPGKTWVSGNVKVYENGMLMGEDSITWTPKGREAKITIGNAPDIEVSKKTTTVDTKVGYSTKRKHTTTLKLKNYKPDSVEVNIIDSYPSYLDEGSFEASEVFIMKPGNIMELNVTLSAGAEKEITYIYIT